MARLEAQYTSDNNYNFGENKEYGELGETIETGAFSNTDVYYLGTKQVAIKEVITDQREASSIKIRVIARMLDDNGETILDDDFKIFNINILSSGMIVVDGGDNA